MKKIFLFTVAVAAKLGVLHVYQVQQGILIHHIPFIYSFIHTFIHSYIHSSIHPSIHPSIHLSIYPFIHPSIYSSIHSFIHSFIYSFIHSFSNPFQSLATICWFIIHQKKSPSKTIVFGESAMKHWNHEVIIYVVSENHLYASDEFSCIPNIKNFTSLKSEIT